MMSWRLHGVFLLCLWIAGEFSVAVAQNKPLFLLPIKPPLADTPAFILPTPPQHDAGFIWNLQGADILSVINQVSKETGKNFIVDPRVHGKVTLVSNKALNADEIYQAFLATLQVHGYSVIPTGKAFKIVPDLDAKYQSILLDDNVQHKDDELVVKVVSVQNVSAMQLVPILRPLLPPAGDISVYAPSNTLIISGKVSKVDQLLTLTEHIDRTSINDIEIVHLEYANAADLVTMINSLQPPNPASPPPVSLVADVQSNSALLKGSVQARLQMRNLIQELDKLNSKSQELIRTQVVYLHYLNAKDFAPILNAIVTGSYYNPPASSMNTKKNLGNLANNTYKQLTSNLSATSISSTTSLSPEKSSELSTTLSAETNKVVVQAEPSTNAVVITGPPPIMQALKRVITQLDIRPAQVLVEAIIVEVDENKLQRLGIQWGTKLSGSQMHIGVGMGPNDDSLFSIITGGLGVGIIQRGNLRVLLNALAEDSSTNILSTPSLIVLDNQQASIKVGKKVSFTNGAYITPGSVANPGTSSPNPFTTTDRQDVALHLDVTPQISRGNSIKLTIDEGNDTLSGNVTNGNPDTNSSSLTTSVIVNSGQTLVLGGLISSDLEERDQKVPILGDIPLLGAPFHNKNHSMQKKNLIIFLRPVILHGGSQGTLATKEKYDFARGLEIKRQSHASMLVPEDANPVLPPFRKEKVLNHD